MIKKHEREPRKPRKKKKRKGVWVNNNTVSRQERAYSRSSRYGQTRPGIEEREKEKERLK